VVVIWDNCGKSMVCPCSRSAGRIRLTILRTRPEQQQQQPSTRSLYRPESMLWTHAHLNQDVARLLLSMLSPRRPCANLWTLISDLDPSFAVQRHWGQSLPPLFRSLLNFSLDFFLGIRKQVIGMLLRARHYSILLVPAVGAKSTLKVMLAHSSILISSIAK
jgi:hypothetical protein